MSDIGLPGFILLIVVALLLFGPKKLPELGNAFGRTLREFRKGASELMSEGERRPEPGPRSAAAPEPIEAVQPTESKKELPE
ncbi:twin-arginine translocase TatA/TatE family subunit [Paenibacillus humicola]|uniref:twin-arginine translocase TatA/TatE family subunit n=1 Tax=Paenibacillus humicola TaxID=3110540 RepID=UPI00237AE40B|nr:twin-arginine translocase TatA/TatE family subunit [Paenibacillus humicola]